MAPPPPKSNTISPGMGRVGTIQNAHKSGQIQTSSSETSGCSACHGRPGVKFEFV